ncbi:MAG: efflux RND transporter permease subunit [Terriglobia bacterium]
MIIFSVQYYEQGRPAIHNFVDLASIPLRAPNLTRPTTLASVVKLEHLQTPTEIDHYQIQRVADVYVTPSGSDLGKVSTKINNLIADMKLGENVRINLRGMVQGMRASFKSFAISLSLSIVLLYLILVAQFRSFKDPLLIMLAIPMGFIGVMVVLPLTHDIECHVANGHSDAGRDRRLQQHFDRGNSPTGWRRQQKSVIDAVITSCRVRAILLMTSLATIIGMVPMALKLGTGSEQYAPLARAIIGGLTASVLFTVYIVPAACCSSTTCR